MRHSLFSGATYLALLFILSSLLQAQAPLRLKQLSQHGITWHFAHPVQAGRYVNGDWWVLGPVKVERVSPLPSHGRHGSMRNPPCGKGRIQGYDSRIYGYDAKSAARFPLALRPGDSLVSSISVLGSRQKHIYRPINQGSASRSWLRSCAILSCVSKAPTPDSFRPAYVGPKRQHRASSIQWQLLPGVRKLPSSTHPAKFARMFERPWLDHLAGWVGRALHPYENMPDYGRDIALCTGEGALILLQDYSRTELRPLMIPYLQLGIDLFGLQQAGHSWSADGGHGNGRKWPIIFAGLMLKDPAMQKAPGLFSEDLQTAYSRGWNGTPVVFRMAGKGSHESKVPASWDARARKDEIYRRCCTSSVFVAHALAAHLMNATELWNDPAFFLYVERWMTPMHPKDRAQIEKRLGNSARTYQHGGTGIQLAKDMWAAYRSRFHPKGVISLGSGSAAQIRLHLNGTPKRLLAYPLHIANAPTRYGLLSFGPPSAPKPGLRLPVYLDHPVLILPFLANASGKATIPLTLPNARKLSIGIQAYWWDGKRAHSSPGYGLVIQ